MPRKRSRYQIHSKESGALKKMRLASGLSLRSAYKRCGIHDTIINHAENGRANITPEYIERFITGMGFSMQDWSDTMDGKSTLSDLRFECKNIVEKIDSEKLKAVHLLLSNFSN